MTNISRIVRESFDNNIGSKIIGLRLDDIVKVKYPNPSDYIRVGEETCTKPLTNKEVKIFARNHPRIREIEGLVYYDVMLKDLPVGNYNYAVFLDTFREKFHIVYGKVTGGLELGVKHSIIAKGFPIYLSGEMEKKIESGIDVYTYNFNSSNFGLKSIRDKAYRILSNPEYGDDSQELISRFMLNITRAEDYMPEEVKIRFETALHDFYVTYIKPYTEEIFTNLSGYDDRTKYALRFVFGEQDVYAVRENHIYFVGLHKYYDEPKKNCYMNFDNGEFLDIINEKGRGEKELTPSNLISCVLPQSCRLVTKPNSEISRMCVHHQDVIPSNESDNQRFRRLESYEYCEQDNNENLIDVLDDLFIQLIYQRENIDRLKNDSWWDDNESNIKLNIIYTIIEAKLNYIPEMLHWSLEDINKLTDEKINIYVYKHFILWFKRYWLKHFSNKIVIDNLDNRSSYFGMGDILFKDLSVEVQNSLRQKYIYIKLLMYLYMRLEINLDIEQIPIFRTDHVYNKKIKIIYGDKTVNFIIKNDAYELAIPLRNVFYNYVQLGKIDVNEQYIDLYNVLDFFTNVEFNVEENVQVINVDELFESIPKPIEYVSLKSKYLKYKAKYLALKKKLNK